MPANYKSACVTGGAGFIGSRLVGALLRDGLAVRVLDNLSVGRRANVPAAAHFVEGDILDRVAVEEAVRGCDVVFHLAARVAIRSSFDFAVEDTHTNLTGAASVLSGVARAKSVRKFIFASSMAVYADAPTPAPIAEDFPTLPVSPYGISKLAAERLTHMMCAANGIPSTVLRFFNTYGPGQKLSPYVGVVTIFVNELCKGNRPTIFGDGEQARDFVHVDDIVQGLLAAMRSDSSGETFNIGSGIPHSVNQVLDLLNQVLGTSLPGRHADPVRGELRYSVADISKATRLLGYRPQHRFESSLRKVVEEILESAPAREVSA